MAKEKYFKQALCNTTRNSNEYGIFCLPIEDAVVGKEIEIMVGYVYLTIVPVIVYSLVIEHKTDNN